MSRYKHGKTGTRMYNIFQAMKRRCYKSEDVGYQYYGGKGVCIDEEWLNDFMYFYKWSIDNGYSEDMTIDRIDADGNYEPSNCRWITMHENILNQDRNKHRKKEDIYISYRENNYFVVNICKGGGKNRITLYNESFYTKKDAVKARDIFIKTGIKTKRKEQETHEFGTTNSNDLSISVKNKKRINRRKEIYEKHKIEKHKQQNTQTKNKVLILKIEDEDKVLIKEAAKQEGISMSNFVREASINRAKRIVKDNK